MKSKYEITEAELPIMKVLWDNGKMTSPEIFEHLEGNVSTFKTLLKRLVKKGSVKTEEINTRTFWYQPAIDEQAYINHERKGFLQRVFNGSKQKMLLNFVQEEKISKEEIEQLLAMIEGDEEQ